MRVVRASIDGKEVEKAIKALYSVRLSLDARTRNKILTRAAKPLIDEARNNIRDSKAPHHRYKNGKWLATYYPGNLRRSIQVLRGGGFRKTTAVFVGPKLGKRGGARGYYGRDTRVDGYYAAFIEFGARHMKNNPGLGYMRRAHATTKARVRKNIINEAYMAIQEAARKRRL